jgi:hypothetical protein
MRQRKKILFAAVDIGYRIELYSKFIEKYYGEQLEPESLTTYVLPKQHYRTSYTYEFHYHKKPVIYRWYRSFLNFMFCLFRYDIFHFFSGETLLTRKLRPIELKIYKLFGKRIVMHFVGSDIRSPQYIYWKEKNIQKYLSGDDDFPKSLPWQKKLIGDAKKYADAILVSTPDLTELLPEAVYYPVMLDLDKYLKELKEVEDPVREEKEIVILHSPSNLQIKGTVYIHEILKNIAAKSKHKIKLLLPAEKMMNDPKIYSVNRYDLFRLYKESDIVIDQMIIGWYGLQSIEALAAGKRVICHIDEHLKHFLFPDCPIEIADINTLEKAIFTCIDDIVAGQQVKTQTNIDWIRKYHTIENNTSALVKAWAVNKETEFN